MMRKDSVRQDDAADTEDGFHFLKRALDDGDYRSASEYVRRLASEAGIDEVFEKAVFRALTESEKEFEKHEISMIWLMRVMQSVRKLEVDAGYSVPSLGRAVVATMDSHTGGRDLIGCYLEMRGFETVIVDAGTSCEDVVDLCRSPGVTACCLSGVFSTSAAYAVRFGRLLAESGVRDRIVFNAGGMAMSAEAAREAGCDVFSESGAESVDAVVRECRLRLAG